MHLIAKDILRFHTVYWPALLMAANIELPKRVFVHGYLLMDGEKMSKSLGNVLDPFAVIDRFGADALRFYLLRDVSFGQDGSVSTASFEQRYESELANDYGNLASRTIAMIVRYRDGKVTEGDPDALLHADFEGLNERVAGLLDGVELTNALDEIWVRVRRLNRYVEEQAPCCSLAKDPERAEDLDRDVAHARGGLAGGVGTASPIPPREHHQAPGDARRPRHSARGRRLRRGRDHGGEAARAAVPQSRRPNPPASPRDR